MWQVEPGREQEFEAMRSWLAWSAALDEAMERTEPAIPEEEFVRRPLPAALLEAYRAREAPSAEPAAGRRLRVLPEAGEAS